MWELDHKEFWAQKNWCFWTVVLKKTLESPLDSKEIKQVNPKEYQSWIFIGRTDAETEAPLPWPPDPKSRLIGKDPDAGKDWGQEKWLTEHEIGGWHHRLNQCESEQMPGDSEGQGSLVCCSPLGCKELDTTWQVNNNKYMCQSLNLLFVSQAYLSILQQCHTYCFRFIINLDICKVLCFFLMLMAYNQIVTFCRSITLIV